ncbi:hypothetical protein [Myxococcus xanthus]|uniref:Uncharacterized protein n=1 Tax=Myxococcus xanthus TaxID=34 RepID=A0A7Y4MQX1_MYXXA|nr:hypothetical protein [Myxococcus xanthus]NOJ79391.1 hypothetical protein [Myxococcus xanthus]NOJ84405.1 hypothetical protein [Myxococcus xanthus]
MSDLEAPRPLSEPPDEVEERQGRYMEEEPGHTPGSAEGDDEDAPHRVHPYPDPDHTPGRAEG